MSLLKEPEEEAGTGMEALWIEARGGEEGLRRRAGLSQGAQTSAWAGGRGRMVGLLLAYAFAAHSGAA